MRVAPDRSVLFSQTNVTGKGKGQRLCSVQCSRPTIGPTNFSWQLGKVEIVAQHLGKE